MADKVPTLEELKKRGDLPLREDVNRSDPFGRPEKQ